MTFQELVKHKIQMTSEFLIGEIDPDQRFCLMCEKYKHKDLMVVETSTTSPLETMICKECFDTEYTRIQEENIKRINDG